MAAAEHDEKDAGISQPPSLTRSIIYGSYAEPFPEPAQGDHTHKWTVYVRGFHDEDISTYIRRVSFKLHDSYPNPNRTVEHAPFEIQESGWGEFQIVIRITFQDPNQRQVQLIHPLKLYPADDPGVPAPGTDVSDLPPPKPLEPVRSEHYEELVFAPPTDRMSTILMSQPEFFDLSTSSRHARLRMDEHDEIQRLDAAIATMEAQLLEMQQTTSIKQEPPSSTTDVEDEKAAAKKTSSNSQSNNKSSSSSRSRSSRNRR